MFIYFDKRFESAHGAKSIMGVICERCQQTYYYELARIGAGYGIAPYWLGSKGAEETAERKSQENLSERLASEAELVPCPKCHWISEELIRGYRLGRYRSVSERAYKIGLIGSISCFVVAWFLHIGAPGDRWLLPYVMIGGPIAFIGMALIMVGIRNWLRNRIQPNSRYPEEPVLPPGTPPALLLDEEETLRPAKPTSIAVEDILEFQYARNSFPEVCCVCLQPGSAEHGHPIKVTRLIECLLPRCETCARVATRQSRRIWLKSFMWGLPISSAIVYGMELAGLPAWVTIDAALIFLAIILILAFTIASFFAPARIVGRDHDRGVVRIRFHNANYVAVVNHFISHSSEEVEGGDKEQ